MNNTKAATQAVSEKRAQARRSIAQAYFEMDNPSIRKLAKQLGVNASTVQRAVAEAREEEVERLTPSLFSFEKVTNDQRP